MKLKAVRVVVGVVRWTLPVAFVGLIWQRYDWTLAVLAGLVMLDAEMVSRVLEWHRGRLEKVEARLADLMALQSRLIGVQEGIERRTHELPREIGRVFKDMLRCQN